MRKYFSEEALVPKWVVYLLFSLWSLGGLTSTLALMGQHVKRSRLACEENVYHAFQTEFTENIGDFGRTTIGGNALSSENAWIHLHSAGDGVIEYCMVDKHGQWEQLNRESLPEYFNGRGWYGRIDIPQARDYYLIKASGGRVEYKHIVPRHHWES